MTGGHVRRSASAGTAGGMGSPGPRRSRLSFQSISLTGLSAIAIGLSACATMGGSPRMLGSVDLSQGVLAQNRTLTQQPRWELEVNPRRMWFVVVHTGVYRAERPRLTITAGQGVYEAVTDAGLRIRVTVTAEPCMVEDEGDDPQLTARVEVGGSVYEGCAAERLQDIIVAGAPRGLIAPRPTRRPDSPQDGRTGWSATDRLMKVRLSV